MTYRLPGTARLEAVSRADAGETGSDDDDVEVFERERAKRGPDASGFEKKGPHYAPRLIGSASAAGRSRSLRDRDDEGVVTHVRSELRLRMPLLRGAGYFRSLGS